MSGDNDRDIKDLSHEENALKKLEPNEDILYKQFGWTPTYRWRS